MFTHSPIKLPYSETNSVHKLTGHVLSLITDKAANRPFVVCCIGTDRSTGDSLGPLVGSRLSKYEGSDTAVFGTLDEPVHAMNLSEKLEFIHELYNDPYIIAVDASLGQTSSIGCIQVASGPLKPGSGVNKQLPSVGDMHMTGIVNVSGFMEYFVLQNTRLSLVMHMADVIADAIHNSLAAFNQMNRLKDVLPSMQAAPASGFE
jgi:putative sporulation protein YyaC